jgi:hypothetical protein
MNESSPVTVRGGTVLGSGLNKLEYAALLLLSVGLFLAYGGLLWRSEAHTSHVMRFVVSYAAVVPMTIVVLLLKRGFSWSRMLTAVGTLWAIKLMITAPLYYAFGPGGGMWGEPELQARATSGGAEVVGDAAATASEYMSAQGDFEHGTLHGVVEDAAAGEAVVMLDKPTEGAARPDPADVTLQITERGYEHGIYVAHVGDLLSVANHSSRLQTVRLVGKSTSSNAPVPPSGTAGPRELEDAGVFSIRSDNDPNLRTTLVVIDHPYAVVVGEDGSFRLSQVPAQDVTIVVVSSGGIEHGRRSVRLQPEQDMRVVFSTTSTKPTESASK